MININYWSVLVAAVSNMIIGSVWYSPILFGKKWMKLMGKSKEDMEREKKGVDKLYLMMFVGALVTAYVMAHFINYVSAYDAWGGAQLGIWIWLGFVMTINLGAVLFEKRPTGLYWINNFYYLVSLTLMGIILAVWR